jgi:hypothetical protein
VARDAAEAQADALPGAVGAGQRPRVGGVLAHPDDAVAGDAGAQHEHGGGEVAGLPVRAERACGRFGRLLGRVAMALGQVGRGCRERERRVGGQLGGSERREPALEDPRAPRADVRGRDRHQQPPGAADVVAGDGVPDRLRRLAVRAEPVARAAVQRRLELGLDPQQLGAERACEHRVVAELRVVAIERLEEDVAGGELVQHGRRAARVEDRVAQRRAQAAQDRGPPQEGGAVVRQAGEQLVADVLGDEPVGPAEAGDRRIGVGLLGDRERGEVQADGPAFGPLDEAVDLLAVRPQPRRVEQERRLEARHGEVARPELDHQPVRAQAADRHGGAPARGQREHRARWQPAREVDDAPHQPLRRHAVGVVEDHDVGARARHDVLDQVGDRVDGLARGAAERLERHPGERALVARRPLDEERGLPVARRRDDHRDRHLAGRREAAQQPRPRHDARAAGGRREPGRVHGLGRRGDGHAAVAAARRAGGTHPSAPSPAVGGGGRLHAPPVWTCARHCLRPVRPPRRGLWPTEDGRSSWCSAPRSS